MCADMKLESGNSALTNSFIHRVERSLMIRTQNNAMRDALRHFKESTGALYRISALSRLPLLAHALKTIKFWHCGASVCTLTSSFAHPSYYPSPPPVPYPPHYRVRPYLGRQSARGSAQKAGGHNEQGHCRSTKVGQKTSE
jgi:hypothetical protein